MRGDYQSPCSSHNALWLGRIVSKSQHNSLPHLHLSLRYAGKRFGTIISIPLIIIIIIIIIVSTITVFAGVLFVQTMHLGH